MDEFFGVTLPVHYTVQYYITCTIMYSRQSMTSMRRIVSIILISYIRGSTERISTVARFLG